MTAALAPIGDPPPPHTPHPPTSNDRQRVRPRDLAIALPFAAIPTAVALDGTGLLTGHLSHVPGLGGTTIAAHPLYYLDLAAIAVLTCNAVARRRFSPPAGALPLLLLFASFLPAMTVASLNPYSFGKVLGLLTVTPLAAVGALLVFDRPARRTALLWVFCALGVFVAALALIDPDPPTRALGALALRGGETITTARIIGYGIVALLCLAVQVRRIRPAVLITVPVLAAAMLLTGSRGPAAAMTAACAVLALPAIRVIRRLVAAGVAAAGLAVGAAVAFSAMPPRLTSRFDMFRGGPLDASAEVRLGLSRLALESIWARPLGLGWGDFGQVVPAGLSTAIPRAPGREHRVYAHNLLLEVGAEGGWIALAGLAIFSLAVARALCARSAPPDALAITSLLMFAVGNALFSSDVNGNILVWVLAGVALAARIGPAVRPQFQSGAPPAAGPGHRARSR